MASGSLKKKILVDEAVNADILASQNRETHLPRNESLRRQVGARNVHQVGVGAPPHDWRSTLAMANGAAITSSRLTQGLGKACWIAPAIDGTYLDRRHAWETLFEMLR